MGLMGSGKTTLARAVSHASDRPFADSDIDIEGAQHRSAHDIAAEEGSRRLHELEAQHLLKVLDGPPAVIAAAASTVDDPACRAALMEHFVVWIDTDIEVLVERFTSGSHRPDYGRTIEVLRAQERLRRSLFTEVADLVVDGITPTEQQRDQVLAALAAAPAGPTG